MYKNMKLNKINILLIDIIVGLIGLILVLTSINTEHKKLKPLLDAIGTSLLATGGVNFLYKLINEDHNNNDENNNGKKSFIKIIGYKRVALGIHENKYTAKKVDIVGISLHNCLYEIANDPKERIIERITSGNMERLRLLFAHPDASFLIQRALEDGRPEDALRDRQKQCIELCVEIYRKIKKYRKEHINMSTLEIRLIDFCPHLTIERFDNTTYWGLYTSDTVGLNSPLFKVTKENNDELFENFKNHFSALREKKISSRDNVLMRTTMNEHYLNKVLIEGIFGSDETKKLLKDI